MYEFALRQSGHAAQYWGKVQGGLCAFAFSALIAGTNMTTPMLPLYRNVLGFSPLLLTMTFVTYVTFLVVVLLMMSRPIFCSVAPFLLSGSIIVAMFGDVIIASATQSGIILGRALAGIAGGLATGAASALVVIALGEKGRSISATGNLVGAVLGTSSSQLSIAVFSVSAMRWTFLCHACLCLIILLLLAPVLVGRRAENSAALSAHGMGAAGGIWMKVVRNPVTISVGCLSWMVLSSAIVLLPSLFAETGLHRLQQFGLIILLICSAIAQLLSPLISRRVPWLSGMMMMGCGLLFVLIGINLSVTVITALGLLFVGAGNGISYRLALMVLVKGEDPTHQGALASAYAAITYGAAAVWVLIAGIIGNTLGLLAASTVVFIILALGTLLLLGKAPRLRHQHWSKV